ncbi:Hsp20/alpha crystallin family protein [Nonomuraea sp. NPDC005501]|uniref:Hsp20/alpha crystallin family protein n=1 Tax=Nonomuraea sp. NPDC005501 TaxID=3156884 RepID=UPI0033BBBAD2
MALLAMRRRGGETYPMREFEDVYGRLGQLMNAALGEFAEEGPRTLLPGEVDAERVEARLSDGVLTITVPKAAAAKPRHLEVTA